MSKARDTSYLMREYTKHMKGHISPYFHAYQGKRRTITGGKIPAGALKHLYRKSQRSIVPRGNVWFKIIRREFTMNYTGQPL